MELEDDDIEVTNVANNSGMEYTEGSEGMGDFSTQQTDNSFLNHQGNVIPNTQTSSEIPNFPALSASQMSVLFVFVNFIQGGKIEMRSIPVPPNRFSPLKKDWETLVSPIIQHLKLQIRYNTKRRCIEVRVYLFNYLNCYQNSQFTENPAALQKASDYFQAFMYGFEIKDIFALLRLDDLFIESFQIKDVKDLHGDHLSRAIGRIAGQGGKTKNAIENATRTRIVLADQKYILF